MRGKTLSIRLIAVLAVFAMTLLAAQTAASQEKVIYNFFNVGGAVNPIGGVIADASGNLYGTAFYGGANGNGMVFELSPGESGWTEKVLYSFNPNGIDGFGPTGVMVFDTAGNLYGTTEFGGTGDCTNGFGCGTAFELSPSADGSWKETIVHDFEGTDGWEVHAGLIRNSAGNLYGTTANGGTYAQGTVFELSPGKSGWSINVLHDFTGGADGGVPFGTVTLDAAGNLYGMTDEGGGTSSECKYGCGVVFELSQIGGGHWTGKILHNFTAVSGDGRYPSAGLIFDASGNLYGVTGSGGGDGFMDAGIVFELMPIADGKWSEKVLHNFNEEGMDGVGPSSTLIFDGSGNLYGVTISGGSAGHGTAFELSPGGDGSWTETILHNFSENGADGYFPNSALVFGLSGNLYATSAGGGHFGEGTVFEIEP